MDRPFDLSTTFVRLDDAGGAEPIAVTPAFWGRSLASPPSERVVGTFAFESSADLHASMQEMHPAADELLFLIEGAIDVVVETADGEQTIALEAGRAVRVPRGAWHRLVMREPGRLLFVNSRSDMQTRPVE